MTALDSGLDSGERFDRDIERQEEIDAKRLARQKELELSERQKILSIFKKWIKTRGRKPE